MRLGLSNTGLSKTLLYQAVLCGLGITVIYPTSGLSDTVSRNSYSQINQISLYVEVCC